MKTHYSNEPSNDRVPRKARKKRIPDNEFQPECTIPLVRVEEDIDDERRKYLSVKRSLPVTVGNPDTVYEKYVQRFETGTPQRWLDFLNEWNEIQTQLALTNGPELYANFKTLLSGDALSKWREVVTANGNQTAANFRTCLNAMTTYVFPSDALSNQQSYLSNLARKTKSHTWRQYDVRLHEENANLAKYPPNFNVAQKLPDAVLRTMVLRTAPTYFQEQIKVQGFDVQNRTTKELITFFETRCESVFRARIAQQNNRKERQPRKRDKQNPKHINRPKGKSKWCDYCKNPTHNTEDCGYLKRKRIEDQKHGHNESKKSNGKAPWKDANKFYKNKSMSKEEIKEFHSFQRLYNKWQAHRNHGGKDHHNVEENDDEASNLSLKDFEDLSMSDVEDNDEDGEVNEDEMSV